MERNAYSINSLQPCSFLGTEKLLKLRSHHCVSVYASLGNLTKATEKLSSKEKERSSSESGSKEGGDKRKRNRVTEKVLNANSNPSSPSAAKRRRT